MVPRRLIRLALVDAVGRMHAHLTSPGLEDKPALTSAHRILDIGPAEDVAKKCARCGRIVGINQGVNAGDHRSELLKPELRKPELQKPPKTTVPVYRQPEKPLIE